LLLCVAGVANAAKTYEVDQKFTSVAALEGQAFAIVNEAEAKAVFGSGAQNLGYDAITTAVTGSGNSGYYFKVEAVEGGYLLRLQTPAGEPYNIWGSPGYLNSGAPGGFDGCFILGLNNQNGQDVKNGAVWEIEYAEGLGFAFKNVALGGYFAGPNPAPTAEAPIYWTLCTLKEGEEVPDPEPVVIPEPEAPLAEGDLIPDFFSICDEGGIPYGYDVKFGSEDRAYPTTYGGGARMFNFAEGGDFTKAIYYREGYVQYGNVKKLALEAGKKYIVYFNSAMWKESGATLEFTITKEGEETALMDSVISNTPNVNGSKNAVTGSTRSEIEFTPEADGNYILKWDAEGWKEVLLANVGVKVATEVVDTIPEEPTPVEPLFADGKYYIYNVGAQKYLAAGANWGTHAVVNADGLDYIITATDGKYTLDSQVSNGGNNHFLNGEWNDGAAMGWTFAAVEGAEGVYTISDGTNFLTAQDNGEVTLAADATAAAAQWTLKTLEARIAELATATAEAPVNATFLIQDANFGRNDLRKGAWSFDASNKNISGGNNINNNAESYHSVFTLSQTLTNAPAGVYQMTAQGFYRQDGEDNENLPVFYANDKTAEFPAKTGEENSMSMASESFTAGLYTIEPFEFIVFEDGQLTIGAKGTATSQWVIFDNFRLTYLTSEIPADNFKPAYEEALATAQATLAAEDYAIVTGEEKTALETVIAEYETVAEESADNFKVAIVALTEATNAFKEAKAGYEELAAAKEFITMVNFDIRFPYASEAKKAAAQASLNAEALSSVDAYVKAYEIYRTYRQFAESNAKLEGLEDAIDMTQKIVNPKAEEAIAEPWVVVKGEGSGGALNILNNEPWTDGDGNSTHKYFDGGNWGAQAWDVALQQKISLPKGKYLLTVKGRASADVALTLFAGEVEGGIPSLGASGNLFNRGWNDSSIEFELAEADSIVIGVRGVTEAVHNWMSFSDFRLYKFPVELPATASIKPTVGITERFTNVADLEGKAFAIINEADGKALYGTNNQNLGYDTYGSAFSASNSGYLWKLVSLANDADTEVQGYYRFQLVTPAGADYNCWGMGGWLNSQPANQACSFILGLNNQNGQDIKNGAVYDVQYVEGQGFSIKNIGTGLYQGANTLPANAEAPSYFTFAAVGTSYVPSVEALLAEGEGWKAFVKDEAAKSAYDAAVAGIDPAAIEGDGLAEAKTVDAAIVELVKAQPAEEGANFTRAIINPSFELGNADGWTSNDGGRVANNGNFGAATGSFFVEKWTAAPNTLSNGSFLQTIYGLPEGKYKVTAEIQNREQGNGDAAGTGLFLVANEDFTEAIANNGETFEVIGTTHRGVLQIGVLLDNCSGNWICFDNFKLTLVETLPAEEPEFANGDVNHDNEVDVTDVVIIIDDILLKNPENFDAALADVNHDNEIDVTDVVLVIDKILGKIELSRGVEASQKDLSAYTAFQMDLTIPAGYVFEGVELTEMAKKSHSLAYNMLSDGRCRVVVFSMDNEALPGAWDEVIRLNLKGQGDAFVNVDRAMFVTVGGERHELLLNGTTSIAQLSTLNSQFSIVYDLQGRKVEKTAKGVYVIDGKKVVIK